MSYINSENGKKVNVIKQKFEQNLKTSSGTIESSSRDDEQSKEHLRRSLSCAVKGRKNLKLNVSRQLSNPSKNIKRTPAFRGDKFNKTKNLHSPTTEKGFSIVDQKVKIFEEKPKYGKIGNGKKKPALIAEHDELTSDTSDNENLGEDFDCIAVADNDSELPLTKDKRGTVRTTVISRQKNISPLYTLDDDLDQSTQTVTESKAVKLNKFFKNGVEYTKVRKTRTSNNKEDNYAQESQDQTDSAVDIREELSRRKINLNNLISSKCIEESSTELSDSLKAALKAPLPNGPPPKKPPRTFAHSPIIRRNVECSKHLWNNPGRPEVTTLQEEHPHLNNLLSPSMSDVLSDEVLESSPTTSTRLHNARDSQKMLEKLETVLIQHQKALGPKVIVARKDRSKDSNLYYAVTGSEPALVHEKLPLHNRLSRTLEDSKKQESKSRKQSAFDCLPYCKNSTAIEPNFKSYFTEPVDLKSNSEDSLDSYISNELSPTSKRLSTEFTTFLDSKRRQSMGKSEERVYAEPFSFDKSSGTDILGFGELSSEEHNYLSRSWQHDGMLSIQTQPTNPVSLGRKKKEPELHYMCTPIEPSVLEDNNNALKLDVTCKFPRDSGPYRSLLTNSPQLRPCLDRSDQSKIEELLNQAFGQFNMDGTEISTDSNTSSDTDSIASTPSTNEELASFNDKLQLFKNRENNAKPSKEELHRSLTEKRKHYVRRVSIKYSEKPDGGLRDRRDRLFDVCLLVELNLSTKEPYVKDKYPIYAQAPAWIENFCFPDAQNWPPSDSNHNQVYSLFLMDEKGNRRYGYCCRVRPEGGPILPLAYCLITKFRASGFYHKVLLELESRHGLPDKRRRSFIEELYNSPMPKPGNGLKMVAGQVDLSQDNHIVQLESNDAEGSSSRKNEGILRDDSERTSAAKLVESLNDSYSSERVIIRSGDPRLEERDMSQLFDAVSNKVQILLFGSLLLERRVVLLGDKLSKLSSCVEALQSLLYPFWWPHTFIPVLPDIPELSEILQAPLPFVIGVLKSKNPTNTQVESIQDGIVVDLDTSKIICAVGDEMSILPSRLAKGIRSALQLVSSNTKPGDGIRNFLVSEAFLRVFVESCAHLEGHLVSQQDGKIIFQKESFIMAATSKTIQYFLEWFVETTMFSTFVTDYIAWIEGTTVGENHDIKLFAQRVAEYQKAMEKNTQSKKGSSKKKTLGDRLKDLTNFYT